MEAQFRCALGRELLNWVEPSHPGFGMANFDGWTETFEFDIMDSPLTLEKYTGENQYVAMESKKNTRHSLHNDGPHYKKKNPDAEFPDISVFKFILRGLGIAAKEFT